MTTAKTPLADEGHVTFTNPVYTVLDKLLKNVISNYNTLITQQLK